jgi:hypothetical protein
MKILSLQVNGSNFVDGFKLQTMMNFFDSVFGFVEQFTHVVRAAVSFARWGGL